MEAAGLWGPSPAHGKAAANRKGVSDPDCCPQGAIQSGGDQRKLGELEEIPLQCAESACTEERDKAGKR